MGTNSVRNIRQVSGTYNKPVRRSESSASSISFNKAQLHSFPSDTPDIISEGGSSGVDAITELTKNEKYSVSRLPANPSVLRTPNDGLYAITDQVTKHGLLVSSKFAYIWDYSSPNPIPSIATFPISSSDSDGDILFDEGRLPFAVLVSPQAGMTEPGLVTIDPVSGNADFYDSTGISYGLLSQTSRIISHTIKLYHGETVSIVTNAEPAGIVATTTSGRFILLSLHDSLGKPCLSSSIIRNNAGNFWNNLSSALTIIPGPDRKDIVAVRPGKIIGHETGEREIFFINIDAKFSFWECSRDGQSKLLFQADLKEMLLEEIGQGYPTAYESFKVHDIHPLENSSNNNNVNFLILTSFTYDIDTFYLLYTIRKDNNDVSVISTYRLTCFSSPSTRNPELFLPYPGNTAFIVFSNAVALVDITKKHKWEDILIFRSGIEIIGAGFEDMITIANTADRHAAVIIISKEAGVIRIEKFEDDPDEPPQIRPESVIMEYFAKSKIEQAVYYGLLNGNPLSFDVPKDITISVTATETALLEVSSELIHSNSVYLPPFLPSVAECLALRADRLLNLAHYVNSNFVDTIGNDTKVKLLLGLEKVVAAKELWGVLDSFGSSNDPEKIKIVDLFKEALPVKKSLNTQPNDPLRSFFETNISKIGSVLSSTIKLYFKHQKSSKNHLFIDVSLLNQLISTTLRSGALSIRQLIIKELFHLDNISCSKQVPWTSNGVLLEAMDSLIQETTKQLRSLVKKNGDNNEKVYSMSTELVELTEILSTGCTDKKSWYNQNIQLIKAGEYDQFNNFFNSRKAGWMSNLVEFNKKEDALNLSEEFQFYRSLVEISDIDREYAIDSFGEESMQHVAVLERFRRFFNKFGYDFAKIAYKYYLEAQKLQVLLIGFPEFDEYLDRFFKENNYQHGNISWIHDILKERYLDVGTVLLEITTGKSAQRHEKTSNRKLQLSLSKLAFLAASESLTNDTVIEQNIDIINHELSIAKIQESFYKILLPFDNDNNDTSNKVQTIVNNLAIGLKKRNMRATLNILTRVLSRVLSKQMLTQEELVDGLTLIEPKNQEMKDNFYLALKQLSLYDEDLDKKRTSLKLIWRRVILLDKYVHNFLIKKSN